MHCLAAVPSGSASPQRAGNCGSVLGVVRALGVLVSEGRVQGPPRGYKEGPHCAAPLQPVPNNHVCEKDNYLCERYVILVREIADRVTTCSYLCVEVLLCTDCPCGMAKATSKDPVLPIPSMSIAPWQQSSEMLLEYWCISVVPSKGPEMMNNQSLYQAVRSRLHFSQVAAWWSRSKGSAPSYIATRVVSFSEDNLRKFRETPSEHTFPLAACGDGNSIKVTVWALPRVEDVPVLNCPIHPVSDKEDEGAARASTPTKNIPVPATTANPEDLVLPTLVDDRLQTPCNEPGKHHCRCEEEDGCPPSPSVRSNGERKRRRSLPRGPDLIPSATPHTSTAASSVLPSVCELTAREHENRIYLYGGSDWTAMNYNEAKFPPSGPNPLNKDTDVDCGVHRSRCSTLPSFNEEQSNTESLHFDNQPNTISCDNGDPDLERIFRTQLTMRDQESNVEKRYKCSVEPTSVTNAIRSTCSNKTHGCRREKSPKFNKKDCHISWDKNGAIADTKLILFENKHQPPIEQLSSSLAGSLIGHNSLANINWTTSTISGRETESGYSKREKLPSNFLVDTLPILHSKANLVINPFGQSSPFHESNPGPSTFIYSDVSKLQNSSSSLSGHESAEDKQLAACDQPIQDTSEKKASVSDHDLSQLMSKFKFPEEADNIKDEKGILDWISKVPSRVFNVATNNNGLTKHKTRTSDGKLKEHNSANEVKSKQNCNLELSQREFDEVLAVLRARTPAGRRRTPLRTVKRRERLEKQADEDRIFDQRSDLKNASDYTTGNGVQNRTVIANRLGIEKFHSDGNDQSLVVRPAKRESMETVSKNVRKVVYPHKSMQYQLAERSLPVVERKVGTRVTHRTNNNCDEPGKQAAKPAECFYNVTNKADVLLGAILRTSKDSRKGLSDISNGARPRTVLLSENCDSREVDRAKENAGGVKPFEDDRLIPSSLNKRISQLRQLFKKEQDKRDWETLASEAYDQESAANYDQSVNFSKPPAKLKNSRDSRVKRRIDFSNLSSDQNESLAASDETHLSTKNSVYQNPLFHGINHKAQNTFPIEIREHASPAMSKKIIGQDGRCLSLNPKKRSTNLKLKIDHRGTETDAINLQENCSDCNSVFSQIENSGKKNYDQTAVQDYRNFADLENNDTSDRGVPSVIEQERFRRSLGNAASMVFHSRTGLPLTSSPAPLRRGSCCFDYDSSLNSVSSKRSALFELNTPPSPGAVSLEEGDREAENICEGEERSKRRTASRGLPHSHALLGSFEESALNGRLEPVSTVHGFTAELGASGSFCPKHRKLPVTVFFYTLGDNDKVSTPYLAHINLGKKGYQVPRSGTIQVTLLNPLGTVVKMFVVMYDLSDMPPRSHTFLRQRTLRDKTLRYLIHLRFMSGKSGRIYLHTDIRMIICRKSDVDTASDLGAEPPKELRSFVHGPTNPKFSPRC